MFKLRTLTNAISFFTGKIAACNLPIFLRQATYRVYGLLTGAIVEEAEYPLESYLSLGDFFSRKLKLSAREIQGPICSPADGTISGIGRIENGELLQAKGSLYTVGELLLDGALAAEFENGTYATIYLAPGDYHRVHSPVTGKLRYSKHIPGALLPVGPTLAKYRDKLFSRNERALVVLDGTEGGSCVVCLVGALNVGCIELSHSKIRSNASLKSVIDSPPPTIKYPDSPTEIKLGEEVGVFSLGSTAIALFSKEFAFEFRVTLGQEIRMGQSLIV